MLWYIVAISFLIVGITVYIVQLIKESKEKESFYYLKSIIEKAEREKITEELNKQLDNILKELKSINNDTNKTSKSNKCVKFTENESNEKGEKI